MKHVLISAISITRYLTTSSSKYLSCRPANRQQRKRLTPALLVAWATCPAPLATWGRALPTPSLRRHRAAWVPWRPPHRRVQRLRRRCGFAGCHVGEASNPGHRPLAHRWAARGSPWQSTLRAAMARERSPLRPALP